MIVSETIPAEFLPQSIDGEVFVQCPSCDTHWSVFLADRCPKCGRGIDDPMN